MRDDRLKWDIPEDFSAPYISKTVTITPVVLARQTVLSGANVLQQIAQPVIEWPQIATDECYALPLRRDRVLVVNGPEIADGWNADAQHSVSDASDTYAVFDLSGRDALTVLNRGTELSLNVQSRSIARLAFGMQVFLYRVADHDRFRIHVAQSQADTLWKHLTNPC